MIGQLYQSLYRIKIENAKKKEVKKVYSKGEGVSSYFQRCLQIEMEKKKMGEKEETRKRAGSGREELSGRAVCGWSRRIREFR